MKNNDVIEDSLGQIWSRAFSKLPRSRTNELLVGFATVVVAVMPMCWLDQTNRLEKILSLYDLLSQVMGTIVGFSIAGFTIYISAYNPKFVVRMWNFEDKESGFSMYKAHILNFVALLIYSTLAFAFTVTVSFLLRFIDHGYLSSVKRDIWMICTQLLCFGATGFLISSLLVQIKSSIYNLYNLAMTQTTVLAMEENSKASCEKCQKDHRA